MPGNLFYFCSEWQRARRVLSLDSDALREVAQLLSPDGHINGPSSTLEKHGLQGGWRVDPVEAAEVGLLGDGLAASLPQVQPQVQTDVQRSDSAELRSKVRIIPAEMMRSDSIRSPRTPDPPQPWVSPGIGSLQLQPHRPSRTARSASFASDSTISAPASPITKPGPLKSARRGMTSYFVQSADRSLVLPATASLLFISNDHPLAKAPTDLAKDDFVQDMQKRLRPERLFLEKPHQKDTLGSIMSNEELEDLFDSLLLLQKPAGGLSSTPTLNLGRSLDKAVNGFFSIIRLRQIIARGASSIASFFSSLDLDEDKRLHLPDVRRIFKHAQAVGVADSAYADLSVGDFTSSADSLAEELLAALDVTKDEDVMLWEMQRQVALAAPPRMALIELVGHFEMKYGYGKCGMSSPMDRHQFYEHICCVELLDLSPEEAMRCFRLAAGRRNELPPADFEKFLRMLPVEVTWGVEPLGGEQLHCAFGTRTLQLERRSRQDACLPLDAMSLDKHEVEAFRTKGSGADTSEVIARFDRLFDRCMMPSLTALPIGVGKRLRDACLRCFLESSGSGPCTPEAKASRSAGSGTPRAAIGAKALPRNGPRSLFPNIGDVLTVPYTRLHAGQSCIVRYRLAGGTNFWSSRHTVMRNEREPLTWPVGRQILGDTPFIGLVPRGLTWSAGGGGGFYLGSQAFSKVDPNLRGDLPRDPASGLPLLFGTVTLVIPSLVRTSRSEQSGVTEDFELRLFCAKKQKIVGCIGEPLFVEVLHQVRPPQIASLQVQCEGTTAVARWAPMKSGRTARGMVVESVRVHMESERQEKTLALDAEVDEWEVHDLLPDTDYDFRVRLENRAGHGREAIFRCRTNSLCSAPVGLVCAASSTAQVELRWHAPKSLGNETTKDKFQESKEMVQAYKASLRVHDDAAAAETDAGNSDDGSSLSYAIRECRWTPDMWREVGNGDITARLSSLRPDTQYMLEGLCAANSIGAGATARSLTFWTVPHTPRIANVKFQGGFVFVGLWHTGGANVREHAVTVVLAGRDPEVKRTFELSKSDLRMGEADGIQGLVLPFDDQPMAEATETHRLTVRARNDGGWSEWSKPFQTQVIARQQGAEQAQATLIRAIEARRVEELSKVLAEAVDIEFPEPRYVEEANELLHRLQAVRQELNKAMQARDPERLRKTLAEATQVRLPDLEKARALLKKLEQVVHKLETAEGIEALKVALKAAHQARLPPELLTSAVERLGTREAAEQAIVQAMEAARVPGLLAALQHAAGMHLPSEGPAKKLLLELQTSEQKLQTAVDKALVIDLQKALEHAETCGLREEELITSARNLLKSLLEEQQSSQHRLQVAIGGRHPRSLRQALEDGRKAQVPAEKLAEGEAVLEQVEDLLRQVANAVGIAERRASIAAAREARVPNTLLLQAEGQLDCLINLRGAVKEGKIEKLRKRLRAAENVGAKPQELLDARVVHRHWLNAEREIDVALAMGQTEKLRLYLLGAMSIGIAEQQLSTFVEAYHTLHRKDAVSDHLQTSIEHCRCEQLQKALRVACDAGVGDTSVAENELIEKGRFVVERLLSLRGKLAFAIEQGELKTTWHALEEAKTKPALPQKEYSSVTKLLADIQEKEKEGLEKELVDADKYSNFRSLDALVARCESLQKFGVVVDDLQRSSEQSMLLQRDQQAQMEGDLQALRTERSYPYKPREVPEIARQVTTQTLPWGVIRGGFVLDYVPPGQFLWTLPREIIEGKIRVNMPRDHCLGDVLHIMDHLVSALRRLLAPRDELKLIGSSSSSGSIKQQLVDLVDGAYELTFAIFVRASHHGIEIVEALCTRGHLGGDLWALDDSPCVTDGIAHIHDAEATESVDLIADAVASALSAQLIDTVVPTATLPEPAAVWEAGLGSPSSQLQQRRWRQLSDHVQRVRPRWLRRLTVELSWTYPNWERSAQAEALDATCLVFNEGHLLEIVDHRGTHGLRYGAVVAHVRGQTSADMTLGAVRHAGDTMDSDRRWGKQAISVRLDLLPRSAVDVVFVMSLYNGKDLTKFNDLRATVIDTDTKMELSYTTVSGSELSRAEAMIMCSLYRMPDGLWHLNSHCQACRGNARDYKPVLAKLLDMGLPRIQGMKSQVPLAVSGIRQKLDIDRDPKPTSIEVAPDTCTLECRFAVELFAKTVEVEALLDQVQSDSFRRAIVKALRGSGDAAPRFAEAHFKVLPALHRRLQKLQVDLRWDYQPLEGPRVSQYAAKEGSDIGKLMENYMDGSCHLFEGQALREVVDYRGPHGVRIVCNGVLDYSGVWIGKIGCSDASAGSLVHVSETMDSLRRQGTQSFQIQLDTLPENINDVFFALSSPLRLAASSFKHLQVIVSDANDSRHVLATSPLEIELSGQDQGEACVLACLTRIPDDRWELHNYKCQSKGHPADYRPLHLTLRAIQERRHHAPEWPHLVAGDRGKKLGSSRFQLNPELTMKRTNTRSDFFNADLRHVLMPPEVSHALQDDASHRLTRLPSSPKVSA